MSEKYVLVVGKYFVYIIIFLLHTTQRIPTWVGFNVDRFRHGSLSRVIQSTNLAHQLNKEDDEIFRQVEYSRDVERISKVVQIQILEFIYVWSYKLPFILDSPLHWHIKGKNHFKTCRRFSRPLCFWKAIIWKPVASFVPKVFILLSPFLHLAPPLEQVCLHFSPLCLLYRHLRPLLSRRERLTTEISKPSH